MSENETQQSSLPDSVTSGATKDPIIRMLIGAGILIGAGLWCFMDKDNYPKPEVWDGKHINEVAGYLFNHFALYVLAPPGLLLAIFALLRMKRQIQADQQGIGVVGKEKIAWDAITQLDATLLKEKGVVVLHYDENTLKLDSWKLTNFKELIALVESKIPADKQKK